MSKWSVETLKEHFDEQLRDRDVFLERLAAERQIQVEAAFDAQQAAITKAEVAAEKRFDAVNEFRGQLADQAQSFMPRREAELQLTSLNDRLNALQRVSDTGSGRSVGANAVVGYLVGAAGAVAAIVTAIATHH